jgi:hypothetical protein
MTSNGVSSQSRLTNNKQSSVRIVKLKKQCQFGFEYADLRCLVIGLINQFSHLAATPQLRNWSRHVPFIFSKYFLDTYFPTFFFEVLFSAFQFMVSRGHGDGDKLSVQLI